MIESHTKGFRDYCPDKVYINRLLHTLRGGPESYRHSQRSQKTPVMYSRSSSM
jgi:hypothetical protein